MDRNHKYPRVMDVTSYEESKYHVDIEVIWKEGADPQRFCGDTWCTGKCGLPALVITFSYPHDASYFLKASGSQVACGNVMQQKRVEWRGETVEVPPEYRAALERRIWL